MFWFKPHRAGSVISSVLICHFAGSAGFCQLEKNPFFLIVIIKLSNLQLILQAKFPFLGLLPEMGVALMLHYLINDYMKRETFQTWNWRSVLWKKRSLQRLFVLSVFNKLSSLRKLLQPECWIFKVFLVCLACRISFMLSVTRIFHSKVKDLFTEGWRALLVTTELHFCLKGCTVWCSSQYSPCSKVRNIVSLW